jgi:para-aminobenzoate synthetase/4-amino-4-deoxychorismate lyase
MTTRVVRRALRSELSPMEVLRSFGADARPVCLAGAWSGGSVLLASEPTRVVGSDEDVFGLLDAEPSLSAPPGVIGGGWFGALRYPLSSRVERLPAPPPRAHPQPDVDLAYYDHLLRYDAVTGAWWFEALWTPAREEALDARARVLEQRLLVPAAARPAHEFGAWEATPGRDGHVAAVNRALAHIADGDVFQVNVCLRIEAPFAGDALDVFADAWVSLRAPYSAYIGGQDAAIVSFSPELFLERRRRLVRSAPIKGTRPRSDDPARAEEQRGELLASAKDRAENVMIVDVMRNDIGRVCEYGSVRAPTLVRAEAHPGVWHLVSDVEGVLRPGVGDGQLLRATFPPASVTGAPKVRAMELIAALEATGREAYTGAIGYASPCGGLEFNVAIRTFEMANGRVWFGSGGGVVADSDPNAEFDECLVKAMPLLQAVSATRATSPVVVTSTRGSETAA